jgi:hypothetical protein
MLIIEPGNFQPVRPTSPGGAPKAFASRLADPPHAAHESRSRPQRFNNSTIQRFNDSTVQRFNGGRRRRFLANRLQSQLTARRLDIVPFLAPKSRRHAVVAKNRLELFLPIS